MRRSPNAFPSAKKLFAIMRPISSTNSACGRAPRRSSSPAIAAFRPHRIRGLSKLGILGTKFLMDGGGVMSITVEKNGPITTVILSRPEVRNAVDRETAQALADAFREFESDDSASVGVLYGDNGTFCAGADLKAIAEGRGNHLDPEGDGPMGPSRLLLSKAVIAAVSGYTCA